MSDEKITFGHREFRRDRDRPWQVSQGYNKCKWNKVQKNSENRVCINELKYGFITVNVSGNVSDTI